MLQQVDYVMVVVSDMDRSVEFYRDKLGLPLKFQSKDWTEFQTGPTTLALHGGGISQTPAAAESHGESFAGTCSIGFSVHDLQITHETLKAKGIQFVMAPTRRDGEGIELAVCVDPDGLPISFARTLG